MVVPDKICDRSFSPREQGLKIHIQIFPHTGKQIRIQVRRAGHERGTIQLSIHFLTGDMDMDWVVKIFDFRGFREFVCPSVLPSVLCPSSVVP
jgi:hypothetical protein